MATIDHAEITIFTALEPRMFGLKRLFIEIVCMLL